MAAAGDGSTALVPLDGGDAAAGEAASPAASSLFGGLRLQWLRACCAVAEGAAPAHCGCACDAASPVAVCVDTTISRGAPRGGCLAAVLGDDRVSSLGGRVGVPRSLGSVYGGYVARCLRGGLRGVKQRVIDTPLTESRSNGVALSRDGGTLFVTDCRNHMVHVYDAHTGSRRRGVGGPLAGAGMPVFSCPHQVWVAADGFLFVAERDSNRVQVLTPDLARHGFVGVGQLVAPAGVCADADVVVVTEQGSEQRVSVFDRADGSLRARFGRRGAGDGELHAPHGVCFVAVDGVQCIAVAEYWNARVSVFTLAGDFVRHVGVGHLKNPQGVACSAANELLVADYDVSAILMFNDAGVLVDAVGRGWFTGVAVHADGTAMFAQDLGSQECVVFV